MMQVLFGFVILLALFLVITELGYRLGIRGRRHEEEISEPEKTATTFVLTLLGLSLAFTLNTAQSHYRQRSEMILKESQSIRSARRALDDLSEPIRTQAQTQMTAYVASKKEYNKTLKQAGSPEQAFDKGRQILHEVRRLCRSESGSSSSDSRRSALDRVDQVAEVGLERHVLVVAPHSDVAIKFLLAIAVIACLLLGHSHRTVGKRIWWAGFLFPSVVAGTLVLILDYDSPRLGLIRVDATDILYEELD